MINNPVITFKYILFAIMATIANIFTQFITTKIYNGYFDLVVQLIAGTIIGLLVKYILDKRFIFFFYATNLKYEFQTFTFYALTGTITTLIFWSIEFVFDYTYSTKEMRYLGGILGLSIGYILKYQLDKRFVFRSVTP